MRVNLAAVDMKLLLVFDAIFAERNVSRAAHRLGMSQPAVSNALNRLRQLVNDQLFLRTSGGMVPTARAEELAGPVQGALRQIEVAFGADAFEPGEGEWTFDLALSDHASVVLLPSLLGHMNEAAPRTSLRFESKRNNEVPDLLDANEIDIAIGVIPDLPGRFSRSTLFHDRYVCMMRADHPLAGRPLTLEELEAADHLAIKPGSFEVSRADRMLQRYGVRRRTITTVHQFLAAPGIIARSDMITLVFERMVGIFDAEKFYFCDVPVPEMDVNVDLVWNRVHTNRPAHRWLRRQIGAACEELAATEPMRRAAVQQA